MRPRVPGVASYVRSRDLSGTQRSVLAAARRSVSRHGAIYYGVLADQTGLTGPTLDRILATLRDLGAVDPAVPVYTWGPLDDDEPDPPPAEKRAIARRTEAIRSLKAAKRRRGEWEECTGEELDRVVEPVDSRRTRRRLARLADRRQLA
jgi:hypothetical protein